MKIANIMNFVRSFEPRNAEIEKMMPEMTRAQLALCREMNLPATFLLEYDALCDEKYLEIIREGEGENIELGFWYEVVEPLTSDIGIPYNSKRGYKWDWLIDPGFSMSYDNKTKERLIDQAMKKFREVFGYYPRTVGSWVIDTYTMNYLCEHYDIDAVCICRDQINTDAYTMVGGYFNGLYYPSKNNIFTPARSCETQQSVPVVRLLGPDPIHNYDGYKYNSPDRNYGTSVYTLEPACPAGQDPCIVDWFFRTYYENESLGYAYTQLGQENSFANVDIIKHLRMQIEKALALGVKFEKMGDTGATFKKLYKDTPATAVSALDNWDTVDCQSVYYDCKNYTANIFRHGERVGIRSLYLFDDRIEDTYLTKKCTTYDSIHENMPIVDTSYQKGDTDGGFGILLDEFGSAFKSSRTGDRELTVSWGEKSIVCKEDGVYLGKCKAEFTPKMCNTKITVSKNRIDYEYKGHRYALCVKGGSIIRSGDSIVFEGDEVVLIPTTV